MAKSGIHIKPSKRGTFTAAATKHGKTVKGFASQVLSNPDNYSSAMVKKANFARNAAKWKKEFGGYLDQQLNETPIINTPIDSGMTPLNSFAFGGDVEDPRMAKIEKRGSNFKNMQNLYGDINKKLKGLEGLTPEANSNLQAMGEAYPWMAGDISAYGLAGATGKNTPPMDPVLEEMRNKVLNLPDEALTGLLNTDTTEGLSLRDANKLRKEYTDISGADMAKYMLHMNKLKNQGYTFASGGPLNALKYLNNPMPQGMFGQVAKGIGSSVGGLVDAFGSGNQTQAPFNIQQTQAGQTIGALGQQQVQPALNLGYNAPQTSFNVPQGPAPTEPITFRDGGILPMQYGLPELGFGSWLGDNAGGILQGAGSAVSAIPGIGMIAGPILSVAGKVTDALVGNNRLADAKEAKKVKDRIDERKVGFQQQLASSNDPSYEAVAEYGGQMGQETTDNSTQIVKYSSGQTHKESATGGIPVDAKGNPSTVSKQSAVGLTEKGEVAWNGYIFSNKLTT